ncbi:MAG: tyrosine-type recombinase/integrase [Acidimicrobiales bacterium]
MAKRLARLCATAGIDRITPYELRHSAASLLSDAGVPIETVADLLGHTTTQMLENVYRHRVRKVIDPGIW